MTKAIDDTLGLNSVPQVYSAEQTDLQTQQVNDDTDFARQNLYDVANKSREAVEDMMVIAQQSQHPKAYEVLNSILKTYADINLSIVDLQMKKQRLENKKTYGDDAQTINNNLFVGSTTELQKMLEDMKNKT